MKQFAMSALLLCCKAVQHLTEAGFITALVAENELTYLHVRKPSPSTSQSRSSKGGAKGKAGL